MKKLVFGALLLVGVIMSSCSGGVESNAVESKAKDFAEKYAKAQFDKDRQATKDIAKDFKNWVKDLNYGERGDAKKAFKEGFGMSAVKLFTEEAAEMIDAVKNGHSSKFETKSEKILSKTESWELPEFLKGYFDKEDAEKKMAETAIKNGICAYISEQLFADLEAPMKEMCAAIKASDKSGVRTAAKQIEKLQKAIKDTEFSRAFDPAIEKCLTAELGDKYKEMSEAISKAYADLDKDAMKTACKAYDEFLKLFPEDYKSAAKNACTEALREGLYASVKAVGEEGLKVADDKSKLREYERKVNAVTDKMSDDVKVTVERIFEDIAREAEEALSDAQNALDGAQND